MTLSFTPHFFEKLPSTQILAHEWVVQRRAVSGDIIVAAAQTNGYGRRGNVWESPQGNLFATLILDMPDARCIEWLGFATSLALYDTAHHFEPMHDELRLKWPNDLMLDGKKLSGILLEVLDAKILVGIGVNLGTAPDTTQPTACLPSVTPQLFLEELFPHYAHWYEIGQKSGFAGMRDVWLQRALLQPQQPITARIADGRVLTGKFIDLDPQGALILQAQDQKHIITAADIFISNDHERK